MQKKGRAEVSFSGRLAAGYGLEIGVYACLGYQSAKLIKIERLITYKIV